MVSMFSSHVATLPPTELDIMVRRGEKKCEQKGNISSSLPQPAVLTSPSLFPLISDKLL